MINSTNIITRIYQCEMDCYYDQYDGRSVYDFNITDLGNGYKLYTAGTPSMDYDLKDLNNYSKVTKKAMLELLTEVSGLYDEYQRSLWYKMPKLELMEELEEAMEAYYTNEDIIANYQKFFNSRYTVTTVVGFSQGDITNVVIPPTIKPPKSGYLESIIYSSPFALLLEIRNSNIVKAILPYDKHYMYVNMADYVNSSYEYNKAELTCLIRAHLLSQLPDSEELVEEINKALPEQPHFS